MKLERKQNNKLFRNLRNKFFALIMFVFSSVIIVAFVVVYHITHNNIQAENLRRLNNSVETYHEYLSSIYLEYDGTILDYEEDFSDYEVFYIVTPLYFNLQLDDFYARNILRIDSNIMRVDSNVDMFERAMELAFEAEGNQDILNIAGRYWLFNISVMLIPVYESAAEEAFFTLTFICVTDSHASLAVLFYVLLVIGLIAFGVVVMAGIYLANLAIKPAVEAWKKQRQFIADASHEFKTPLTIIKSNYGVLVANSDETIKSQSEWLDYIKIGIERISKLIDSLLDLARTDEINPQTQKQTFCLSALAKEAVLEMEATAFEKGIKINTEIEPDIQITSDIDAIKQILSIFLDNAIKYTNENGTIEVLLKKVKRQVVCSVKNSGKGIKAENLPKVFDRFYRGDQSRSTENASYGLGLSIAKATIDRLGGRITAESTENKTTTFSFMLPVRGN